MHQMHQMPYSTTEGPKMGVKTLLKIHEESLKRVQSVISMCTKRGPKKEHP